MRFSQRIGKRLFGKDVQLEKVDQELKIGLWNVYCGFILRKIDGHRYNGVSPLDKYFDYLWYEFYKLPIDTRELSYDKNAEIIRKQFYGYEWFDLYDFIEFNANWEIQRITGVNVFDFRTECNKVLEREFSAYRFIEEKIVAISSQPEMEAVHEALSVGAGLFRSPHRGVNMHLQKALDKLADKKKPDYSNSIKESISAVEALLRVITGESTLGDSLKQLERKGILLNPQFKSGIEKLYAYTNNKESGIRHALIDSPNLPTFEDAKFMLVTCSAFINYIISKG